VVIYPTVNHFHESIIDQEQHHGQNKINDCMMSCALLITVFFPFFC